MSAASDVAELVARARAAQATVDRCDQARADELATAAADAEHGTMLVVHRTAAAEARRLRPQRASARIHSTRRRVPSTPETRGS